MKKMKDIFTALTKWVEKQKKINEDLNLLEQL